MDCQPAVQVVINEPPILTPDVHHTAATMHGESMLGNSAHSRARSCVFCDKHDVDVRNSRHQRGEALHICISFSLVEKPIPKPNSETETNRIGCPGLGHDINSKRCSVTRLPLVLAFHMIRNMWFDARPRVCSDSAVLKSRLDHCFSTATRAGKVDGGSLL